MKDDDDIDERLVSWINHNPSALRTYHEPSNGQPHRRLYVSSPTGSFWQGCRGGTADMSPIEAPPRKL